ncbi:MAG: GNAT family N-acetyltransferase [Lachnospiraceae bacterium]|nr:GNAT family N-acetyltransferase [Lachnospiraceae bacterium]
MITFYKPEMEDLWFKETMLGDEQTMSYNHAYGGTIPFPREKWAGWYDRWLVNHENRRFYRYIKENDTFLGEAAYHFDDEKQNYLADVIIYAPYRGKGYGRRALEMLCEAAKENGLDVIYDEIAVDNPLVSLFLNCGFEEVQRTEGTVLVKKKLGRLCNL